MACAVGELAALLENARDAEVAPAACGVKVTVKPVDCPAASVTGKEIPESTNSLLLSVDEEIVTLAPLAVRVPVSGELDPTVTLPNARLVGVTASWPAELPVPENPTLSGELGAVDNTDRVALEAPDADGAKVAVNVTL
jgi:hypothetical protein